MKYGIAADGKFVLIDEDLRRVQATLAFMPSLEEGSIGVYQDGEVEQGCDMGWYLKAHAPQKPLVELKMEKLALLGSAFANALAAAHCMSSAGFEIDANDTAVRNIDGLLLTVAPEDTVWFRACDNRFHQVTRAQLETMRKEIAVHNRQLYQMKWAFEHRIRMAETAGDLERIAISWDTSGPERVPFVPDEMGNGGERCWEAI